MRVPIQDLARHTAPLAEDLADACRATISSGWFVLGKRVADFEAAFASYLGAQHCVSNANGTDAIELALRAVGVGPGDRVILAANAGMYATVATLAIGAQPHYVDIDPRTYSLDPAALASALLQTQPRAVILTHLYGIAGRVKEVAHICQQARVPLVEDCAECHGARVEGRALGTWGAVGCFSFYPTKNLGAIGDGGACTTGEETLAIKLRHLRQYGWSKRYEATLPGGRNSRLDEIQAAVLLKKLPHLDRWNARRKQIAHRYNSAFADLPLSLPKITSADAEDYVGHLYVVRSARREALRAALTEAGVATDIHFPLPDYRQAGVAPLLDKNWSLPETEKSCAEIFSLPCFPELTDAEVEHVITSVRQASHNL